MKKEQNEALEVATSYEGRILAAVSDSPIRVHVWDFITREKIIEFATLYDRTGDHIAISNDGSLCATAAEDHGVTMHRTSDGDMIWWREDLTGAWSIFFDHVCSILAVVIQGDWVVQILNPSTGDTIRQIEGVLGFDCSPYQAVEVVGTRDKLALSDALSHDTIAVLQLEGKDGLFSDWAFAPEVVFVSEFVMSTGSVVSAFSTRDGAVLWRYRESEVGHFLRLGFIESTNTLWAIFLCSMKAHFPRQWLLAIAPDNGSLLCRVPLKDFFEGQFALRGERLITTDGDIYDLTDSSKPKVIAHLDFP